MAKAKRTTHRSSSGKKLYAVRDSKGRFKDIQTYERAHRADLKKKSKKEKKEKAATEDESGRKKGGGFWRSGWGVAVGLGGGAIVLGLLADSIAGDTAEVEEPPSPSTPE